jgi:hypothetical protein
MYVVGARVFSPSPCFSSGNVVANRTEGDDWSQWLVEKCSEKGKVNLRSFHGK